MFNATDGFSHFHAEGNDENTLVSVATKHRNDNWDDTAWVDLCLDDVVKLRDWLTSWLEGGEG